MANLRFAPALIVWLLFASGVAKAALAGDVAEVESITATKLADRWRIVLVCNPPTTHGSLAVDEPPGLVIYFLNARLTAPDPYQRFEGGPIRLIRATESGEPPTTVDVFVSLEASAHYEIGQASPGRLYVDVFAGPAPGTEVAAQETTVAEALPRISLDVRQADIADVLRLLAEQSDFNLVIGKGVEGPLTVKLTDVRLRDALDTVVRANGFDYTIRDNIVIVKTADAFGLRDFDTRVFHLKYVDASHLKNAVTPLLSEGAEVQVFYHNFQAGASEGTVEQPIGEDKGSRRSSTLIVTAAPHALERAAAMIAGLDVPPPQIMIEAKLVEVSPQHTDRLGINWSKTINAQIFDETSLPSGGTRRYSAELPLEGGGITYGTLSVSQFNAVLDFLRSQTNSKLISNPRILATDNQQAEISVGTTVPIPQINRGVGGQGDVVTFEYRDVNIALRVTPHVGADGTITLAVNPVIEEITGEVVAGENRVPITSKREVRTVVNVRSEETIVIGGLIKENTIEKLDKVWLLGDVPLLGGLFSHKELAKQQTDLLIFITPRTLK